ncbi:winged helix-turn-helix transcriptional regulator [Pedobacter sp. AW1-32]|uniref:winged helix-turn-helix transcriptional regulator n=1 Tax=Pedobacter sp. AW1-32 TaxID=3383026 RepID=UPI003FEEEC0B
MRRNATCGEEPMAIHDSLNVLGGKWKLMILCFLANRIHQTIHFAKLLKEIGSISGKMLRKELRALDPFTSNRNILPIKF